VDENAIYYVTICCRPRGSNQLCTPARGAFLRDTIARREELGQWWVSWTVLMPDHAHMLVSVGRGFLISTVVAEWKRYNARYQAI
jgi:REP element-mobilizing transposase RayT